MCVLRTSPLKKLGRGNVHLESQLKGGLSVYGRCFRSRDRLAVEKLLGMADEIRIGQYEPLDAFKRRNL